MSAKIWRERRQWKGLRQEAHKILKSIRLSSAQLEAAKRTGTYISIMHVDTEQQS